MVSAGRFLVGGELLLEKRLPARQLSQEFPAVDPFRQRLDQRVDFRLGEAFNHVAKVEFLLDVQILPVRHNAPDRFGVAHFHAVSEKDLSDLVGCSLFVEFLAGRSGLVGLDSRVEDDDLIAVRKRQIGADHQFRQGLHMGDPAQPAALDRGVVAETAACSDVPFRGARNPHELSVVQIDIVDVRHDFRRRDDNRGRRTQAAHVRQAAAHDPVESTQLPAGKAGVQVCRRRLQFGNPVLVDTGGFAFVGLFLRPLQPLGIGTDRRVRADFGQMETTVPIGRIQIADFDPFVVSSGKTDENFFVQRDRVDEGAPVVGVHPHRVQPARRPDETDVSIAEGLPESHRGLQEGAETFFDKFLAVAVDGPKAGDQIVVPAPNRPDPFMRVLLSNHPSVLPESGICNRSVPAGVGEAHWTRHGLKGRKEKTTTLPDHSRGVVVLFRKDAVAPWLEGVLQFVRIEDTFLCVDDPLGPGLEHRAGRIIAGFHVGEAV